MRQRHHDYCPGQKVLKKVHNPTKLGVRTSGPYPIERVHVNGNLTILLRPGVTERINIRRIIPYRWLILFHLLPGEDKPLSEILVLKVFQVFYPSNSDLNLNSDFMAESLFAIEGKSAVPNTRYLNLWVSQILVTGIRTCTVRLISIVAIGR
mgnify:CR=1 FL=1